jgi:hypothetical protein
MVQSNKNANTESKKQMLSKSLSELIASASIIDDLF